MPSRVTPISPEQAKPEVKEIYKGIQQKMGALPNIFKNMGNSLSTLEGYLGLSKGVEHSSLSPKLKEQIALAVGQANDCHYCLAAHNLGAKKAGVSDQDILLARKGDSQDPKTKAILKFVKLVIEKKAHVTDQDVQTLKAAGVSDQELVEIVMVITINLFTNYFNIITNTVLDFPEAPKV